MEYDASYKPLSLRMPAWWKTCCAGLSMRLWVREVDFTTLERVSGSYVSDDLRDREDDMIWRVRWGADWLYIYLLLEFRPPSIATWPCVSWSTLARCINR
jgi:hypothetical protein